VRLLSGDASIDVNGFGLRDHSWGPGRGRRPNFYRWVHGSTDGLGFMAPTSATPTVLTDRADSSGMECICTYARSRVSTDVTSSPSRTR